MLEKLQEIFNNIILSEREKKLLAVCLFLLVPFLIFRLVFVPFNQYQDNLKIQLQRKEISLENIKRLKQEYKFLRLKTASRKIPLAQRINRILKPYKQSLKSQIVPVEEEGIQNVVIKLDQLKLKELKGLLYLIENQKPVIRVSKLEVSHSYQDNTLLQVTLSLKSL